MKLFRNDRGTKEANYVVVVSGLPRSGTSMMMKMLEAGGLTPITDHIRTADIDNPKGYYEFERVKKLPDGDSDWLDEAQGKVVKVISALLEHLPSNYHYRIIFMKRNMEEILASQRQMLIHENKPIDAGASDEVMANVFQKHLAKIETWLEQQPNMEVFYADYNTMLKDPATLIVKINSFLDSRLSTEEMAKAIDRKLYRQRKAS